MPKAQRAIRKLNHLLELDYDAVEAYEAAIAGLTDPKNQKALAVYCGDHRRHTQVLSELVIALGGKPARGPDWRRVLTVGKVQLAKLVGGDRAILIAMRINEEVTNRRYELAIAMGGMDATTLKAVRANLADERRHRLWISRRLKGQPTHDPAENPAADTTVRSAPRRSASKASGKAAPASPRKSTRKRAPKTGTAAAGA